jgi:hypothetical protein
MGNSISTALQTRSLHRPHIQSCSSTCNPSNVSKTRTLRLSDGGLVDNLGLLTLYAYLLDPDFYRLARGRLQRIVVISIDAENRGIAAGMLAGLDGLSTWSESALHRFVIPAMVHRARLRELGDELDLDWWKNFSLPTPRFYSFSICAQHDMPTRFKLSLDDREYIDKNAFGCVPDYEVHRIEKLLGEPPEPRDPIYDGRMTGADIKGLIALKKLAGQEALWWRDKKIIATVEQLTNEPAFWHSPIQKGNV